MALDYDTYVSQLANLIVISTGDSNFTTALPGIISDAEQRIYRELDPLGTRITNTTTASSGVRTLTLPTSLGTFLVVEQVNVLTPVGAGVSSGTRNPVTNASRDFISLTYPSALTATGVPEFWSMTDNATIVFGPSPGGAYITEIIGTIRPTPLSSGNSSTILTQMLPDLMIDASMVFAQGYLKNYSGTGDDPGATTYWEKQYQTHMMSAMIEEVRKKYQSQGWTNTQPSPVASPPRV